MRRLPVLPCVAALLLSGCDLFSTREFRSKPSDIRVLPGLAQAGDSVAFLATEALWRAGGQVPEQVVSKRRVTFFFGKDSIDGGDTVKVLTLRIREDSSGQLVDETRRLVRFTSEGVELPGVAGGAARYYPLKTAATAAVTAPGDSDAFLVLPSLLIEGWNETTSMGLFTVNRTQTVVDTLGYRGHFEEAWVIAESVLDGDRVASSGKYWYGASGLLKAEQAWDDFDWRGTDGNPARSEGGSAIAVSLRRTVVRQ
ncbi:MAG: hypothetical protein JF616_08975 [Fibrobacteres bacterium]|jgi:hypothetical protein|nr:hypothetical protein [Fibrobacterota bacterium]